jgi:tRNA nucleotidyltransferase (CCA-adding enzyme)
MEAHEVIAEQLTRLEPLAGVFEAVSTASEPFDGVYLVGGSVRDVLLGEPSLDVDIAVEGDAIAFARTLADRLHGRVRPHEQFGTAVVSYGDGERIDVAITRTESYPAPAVLPTVEQASIGDDLRRRDFTINALAASLKGDDFGRLVDPFGGRNDLESGTIRVLHDRSFVDDPTRIFRAIRYESRFGFRMEPHTEELARSCVGCGLVGDLSGARVPADLVALLEDGEVDRSIARLAELDMAHAIHPLLVADDEAVALLRRLRAIEQEYGLEIPAWRLGLLALARRMPAAELRVWLQRLKLRRADLEQIVAAVTDGPRIVEVLSRGAPSPAEIVAAAEPHAPDAPLFALALADLPQLRSYFEELRDVRLEVTGLDLARLGLGESPRVGEILAELRRRKLNGELDGREAELSAARELIAAP